MPWGVCVALTQGLEGPAGSDPSLAGYSLPTWLQGWPALGHGRERAGVCCPLPCVQVEQLHKIFKLCGSPSEEYWRKSKLPHATIFKPSQPYKRNIKDIFKDFSATSLALLDILLAIEPADRGSATAALSHEVSQSHTNRCPEQCAVFSLMSKGFGDDGSLVPGGNRSHVWHRPTPSRLATAAGLCSLP